MNEKKKKSKEQKTESAESNQKAKP